MPNHISSMQSHLTSGLVGIAVPIGMGTLVGFFSYQFARTFTYLNPSTGFILGFCGGVANVVGLVVAGFLFKDNEFLKNEFGTIFHLVGGTVGGNYALQTWGFSLISVETALSITAGGYVILHCFLFGGMAVTNLFVFLFSRPSRQDVIA